MYLKKIYLVALVFINAPFAFSQNCNNTIFTGEGTFYGGVAGNSSGNCSLPVDVGDYYHCAMNDSQYDNSNACGAFVKVTGPKGTITLKVVDRCPECLPGDIDMTQEAFSEIAEVMDGRVPISWQFVPANSNETIKINFKTGSSQHWTAIQFRDIEHAIASVEYQKQYGAWQLINRELFNFFIEPEGIPSPMNLRINSILGESLFIGNVVLNLSEDFDTGVQFATPDECNNPLYNPMFEYNPIVLYPNPTKNTLKIKGDFDSWFLMDLNGKLLQDGSDEKIQLQELPNGVYILRVRGQVKKVIKY